MLMISCGACRLQALGRVMQPGSCHGTEATVFSIRTWCSPQSSCFLSVVSRATQALLQEGCR
jgi:hypothetical protein